MPPCLFSLWSQDARRARRVAGRALAQNAVECTPPCIAIDLLAAGLAKLTITFASEGPFSIRRRSGRRLMRTGIAVPATAGCAKTASPCRRRLNSVRTTAKWMRGTAYNQPASRYHSAVWRRRSISGAPIAKPRSSAAALAEQIQWPALISRALSRFMNSGS